MSRKLTRRQVLAQSMGAAAVAALAPRGARAEVPDRSADAPTAPVAIQRCASYEPQLLRQQLDTALDAIGGIGKLVANKTVTVKLNLTGQMRDMHGLRAWDTYQNHPNMTAALCAALHDAGAKRIVLVEALYYKEGAEEVLINGGWDLNMIKAAGGHKVSFVNTKNLSGFKSYSRMKVSHGGFMFPAFDLNRHYEDTDVFISLGKMKDHETAGVTMTVKNLFGITPTALYGNDAPNEDTTMARGAILHTADRVVPEGVPGELDAVRVMETGKRVPRITADCLGARPVDLALIEGINTIKGGEGYWNKNTAPVQPKLILAGRNAVCTDAVCTAVMGYDPMAAHWTFPFDSENHLALAAQAGIGTNDIGRIEVRGEAIEAVKFPFLTEAEFKQARVPGESRQQRAHRLARDYGRTAETERVG